MTPNLPADSLEYWLDNKELCDQYRELIDLYQSGSHYEILARVSSTPKSTIVPPLIHFLLGCTLFNLGRIGGALREVSLAIELEPNTEKRMEYIKCLATYLYSLGFTDKTIDCFGEVVDLAFFQQGTATLQAAAHSDLEKLLNSAPKPVPESDSLYEQALKYKKAGGRFAGESFGDKIMSAAESVQSAFDELAGWDKKRPCGAMSALFDAIMKMVPECVLKPLVLKKEEIVALVMLEQNMERVSFSQPPKCLLRELKGSRNNTVVFISSMAVKHHMVEGYIDYCNKDHSRASTHFSWVCKFLHYVLTKLNLHGKSVLSHHTKCVATMYYIKNILSGQNVLLQPEKCVDKLVKLNEEMVKAHEKEPVASIDASVLVVSGRVYEYLSTAKAARITAQDQTLLHLDRNSLSEMLLRYTQASVKMLASDPTVVYVYERIIWGLLMYGGTHLYTLWFFMALKDHYYIEFDFGPVKLAHGDDYRVFEDRSIIDRYKNGWELVDKTYELSKTLHVFEGGQCWEPRHATQYLLPTIFEHGEHLVVYEGELTESEYFFSDEYHLRPKRKSALKRRSEVDTMGCGLSRELVRVWVEGFERRYGRDLLPRVVEGCGSVI